MEKSFTGLAVLVAILGLIIGGLLTYALFPKTVEIIKEVPKEVPVERIVEVPVEKIVEKECPVADEKTCATGVLVDYRDNAVNFLLESIEDDEDLQECNNDVYDFEQIAVKKVYDEYVVENIDDKDGKYEVTAKVRLKYLDSDTEEKCYKTLDFKVAYELNEEPILEIL